jgi:hypothetical protein
MISLITVSLPGMEPYVETLLNSVARRCNLISEVVVCHTWKEQRLEPRTRSITRHDGSTIIVKDVDLAAYEMWNGDRQYGHAEGLHRALEYVTQEYTLFSDPDLFFYTAADQIYLENMKRYDLNIVGVSHHWAHNHAAGWFPLVINCMVKTDTLPGPDWKAGRIKFGRGIFQEGYRNYDCVEESLPVTNKWLIQGAIPECVHLFPHHHKGPGDVCPMGFWYDIGCNMYLWNLERDGKWLAFQTLDTQNYTTAVYRTNFKLRDKFKNIKLLFHLTNGYHNVHQDGPAIVRKKYEETIQKLPQNV